eukprot:TRINITY_DN1290_c2_g2_i6.p1 TRINITY_DN1290_c2_g2~~TRINITY_DN1290_c2_g2_i6.p1  ORF type:complete len:128 (-),score=7.72 TRINITY_DN1290_c2_g2_i6:193-576(-)
MKKKFDKVSVCMGKLSFICAERLPTSSLVKRLFSQHITQLNNSFFFFLSFFFFFFYFFFFFFFPSGFFIEVRECGGGVGSVPSLFKTRTTGATLSRRPTTTSQRKEGKKKTSLFAQACLPLSYKQPK